MKLILTALLAASLFVAPTNRTLAQNTEPDFPARLLHHVHSRHLEHIEQEIRKQYGSDVELEFVGVHDSTITADSVIIIPAVPHPDVMLGCVVIVIVVSATVLGGVIYIVVTKCNRSLDNLNPPPLHQGPTNFHPAI